MSHNRYRIINFVPPKPKLPVALRKKGLYKNSRAYLIKVTEGHSDQRVDVARERFELSSMAPKATMLGHYTTGLQMRFGFCVILLFFFVKSFAF
jgi:hypothetical protein